MSIISQNYIENKELNTTVRRFFSKYKIAALLRKCNAGKEKGISVISVFLYLFGNIFLGRSMYMQMKTSKFKENFSKNTVYRFLNSTKTNWLRFTTLLATDVINRTIKPLTSEKRSNVFIFDDTLFSRTGYKKTELASRVFDHNDRKYKKGFRMLTLGWSDGNTFIPVNSCLLASSQKKNILGTTRTFDKRTIAGRRRTLALKKGTEAMIDLLDTALSAGLNADHVLFDTWFANPAQIVAIKNRSMDVIAMLKKSSKIYYEYNGEKLSVKQIYSKNRKRPGHSKYLLSVDVMLGKTNPIPAKIVFVRNKVNRKDWLAFVCTNTQLSEEEIIRIYGKRWDIEVFFKTCKSRLNLIKECHSLSYDALTAHTSIVFARYILLAVEQRMNEDMRSLGELFYIVADELEDITFSESLRIITEALIVSLTELFKLTDQQLLSFVANFESRLPKYLQYTLSVQNLAT